MRQIIGYKIKTIQKILELACAFIFLLPTTLMAVGEESDVLFDDEPTAAIESTSSTANTPLLNFSVPENTYLLMMFMAIVVAIVLGIILYRAMLKNQVTKGVHPREFFASVVFAVFGFFILSLFFILIQSSTASLGWFTVLAGTYLFLLVVFLAMGRLRNWIFIILVAIAAIIGFQLFNMNLF